MSNFVSLVFIITLQMYILIPRYGIQNMRCIYTNSLLVSESDCWTFYLESFDCYCKVYYTLQWYNTTYTNNIDSSSYTNNIDSSYYTNNIDSSSPTLVWITSTYTIRTITFPIVNLPSLNGLRARLECGRSWVRIPVDSN